MNQTKVIKWEMLCVVAVVKKTPSDRLDETVVFLI